MTDPAPFRWRSVIVPVYLPTALFSLAEGALIPLVPVLASNVGAGLALAGFVGGLFMLGTLAGDIPAGWLVSRIGERNAMLWASFLAIIGMLVAASAPSVLALAIGVFLIGAANSVFALARHSFLTTFVPMSHRARALSTLGGVFRGGFFIGPFVSAGLIVLFGESAVVWASIAATAATIAVLLLLKDPESSFGALRGLREERAAAHVPEPGEPIANTRNVFATLWSFRSVYVRIGIGAAILNALRSARMVVLPLWAVAIGVSAPDTALVIGIAGAIDFALFYPSGQLMDRFGRLWSALPSLILMALAFILLAFTANVANAATWFVVVAMVLAVANGFSAGVVLTFSADLAPRGNPAPFLSGFRLTTDAGAATAPLLVAGLTSLVSLPFAVGAVGALGFVGAWMLGRWVPRLLPNAGRPPKR